LLELLLGLVRAGDVGEGDLGRIRADQLGLGATELEGAVSTRLHGAEDPDPERDEEQPGERAEQNRSPPGLLTLALDHHALGDQLLLELGGRLARNRGLE